MTANRKVLRRLPWMTLGLLGLAIAVRAGRAGDPPATVAGAPASQAERPRA